MLSVLFAPTGVLYIIVCHKWPAGNFLNFHLVHRFFFGFFQWHLGDILATSSISSVSSFGYLLSQRTFRVSPVIFEDRKLKNSILIVEIIGKGGDDKEEEVGGNACYHQLTVTLRTLAPFLSPTVGGGVGVGAPLWCGDSMQYKPFQCNNLLQQSVRLLPTVFAHQTIHWTELPRSHSWCCTEEYFVLVSSNVTHHNSYTCSARSAKH